jgi:hypothetical protein
VHPVERLLRGCARPSRRVTISRDAVRRRGRRRLSAAAERLEQNRRDESRAEDLQEVVVRIAGEPGVAVLVGTLHAVKRHALAFDKTQTRRGNQQALLADFDVHAVHTMLACGAGLRGGHCEFDEHGRVFEQRDWAHVDFANQFRVCRYLLEQCVGLQSIAELPRCRAGHLRRRRVDVGGHARRFEAIRQHRLDREPANHQVFDGRADSLRVWLVGDELCHDRMAVGIGRDANNARN